MEEYKQKEIEYYDNKAVKYQAERKGDFEGFDPKSLSSLRFCYNWFEKNCQGKKFLDYGCGNGIHSMFPAECGAEVIGIDLSEKSLEIARKRTDNKIPFILMDCEKMDFPDDSFDIVFDGGAFSSLDLNKVFPEIARALETKGYFIGIETLGHNFFIFSLFFPIAILFFDLILGSYIILSLFFSIKISIKNGFKYFFLMPIVFLSRHIGYGLGSIWGLIK